MRSLALFLERRILQNFDFVSSISNAMVHKLYSKGVDPNLSYLFPNWVDLDSIRPRLTVALHENPYRRDFGIRSDQLVLMYSGSMNKKQGLDLLVEVIPNFQTFLSLCGS